MNKLLKKLKLKNLQVGDFWVMVFFIIFPIIFYSYRLLPKDIKEIEALGYVFTSNYYESVRLLVWTLVGKFMPFIAFSIVFLRVKKTWSYSLFIPIGMYLFQMVRVVNDDAEFFDTIDFFYILPFIIIYCYIMVLCKRQIEISKAKNKYKEKLVEAGMELILSENKEYE